MKEIKDSKDIYDAIKIPVELSSIMDNTIEKAAESKPERSQNMKKHSPNRTWIPAAVAAVLVIGITIGLNTNEAFAKSAGELPIIGSLAKVLTIRDYQKEDNVELSIEQPEIVLEDTVENAMEHTDENTNEGTEEAAKKDNQYVADVNASIEKIVSDYKADATKRIEEYKEAFFATGGTEEEWLERGIDIDVSYEVKYQTDTILSLVLTTNESWVSAYGQQYFFNMDLENGKDITLKELLGENYVEIANEAILKEIKRQSQEEGKVFWGYEQYNPEYADAGSEDDSLAIEGFKTVTEETKFYINEAGNPVVVFDKYEIAPGYVGSPEFEIIK